MKSIAHRGASAIAPENSLEAIRVARKHGVDYIEVDVRKTADNKLVIIHDEDTYRTHGIKKVVAKSIFSSLPSSVASLDQAIKAAKNTPLILELKEPIPLNLLHEHLLTNKHLSIASFDPKILYEIRKNYPHIKIWVLEKWQPYRALKRAQRTKAYGIGIHLRGFSPLLYALATKRNIKVFVYTINNPILAKILVKIFPELIICTDKPDKVK